MCTADDVEPREQSRDDRAGDGLVVAHFDCVVVVVVFAFTTILSCRQNTSGPCRDAIYATVDKKTQAREVKQAAEAIFDAVFCES